MANKTNKYGRQIFLTREHIVELRRLVDDEIVSLDDYMRDSEELLDSDNPDAVAAGEGGIEDAERGKALLEDIKAKLWYYVDEGELEVSK